MFTLAGILLLVVGASLTFAVDRPVDDVDLLLVGWIVMAGGGLSLTAAMLRAAALDDDDRLDGVERDSFDGRGPDGRQHGRQGDRQSDRQGERQGGRELGPERREPDRPDRWAA